jgi:hypothetical protein
MSIVSYVSSCSESTVEPDPNLMDRLVDDDDASSQMSDVTIPRALRDGNNFFIPDVSDKKWTYGDLGHTADPMSASFLPDPGCSAHLRHHGIILDSTLFSGSGVLLMDSPSDVDNTNFWEEHDRFDQNLKSSEFRDSTRPEDPVSPGSKLQARTIEPFPLRSLMLMPKSKAPEGFLKRILKRAKSVRIHSGS